MSTPLLKIDNLSATVGGKKVIQGLSLAVNAGEVHAIMGPNGSGKSTLAYVLAGRPGYEITGGSVQFEGQDLTRLAPEERARAGLFLGFQYPVEIPGVNNVYLLKAAVNARRKAAGLTEVDAYEFLQAVRAKTKLMQMDDSFLARGVNEGFSGGEKKRNEILQMLVIEPKLAVLDETDSGLDIDALKVVARGVNSLRAADRGVLLITHYQRLLEHVVPDFVHVLARGRIAKSGDKSLALELATRTGATPTCGRWPRRASRPCPWIPRQLRASNYRRCCPATNAGYSSTAVSPWRIPAMPRIPAPACSASAPRARHWRRCSIRKSTTPGSTSRWRASMAHAATRCCTSRRPMAPKRTSS